MLPNPQREHLFGYPDAENQYQLREGVVCRRPSKR